MGLSATECEEAAADLGYTWGGVGTYTSAIDIAGCQVLGNQNNKVILNNAPNNGDTPYEQYLTICKKGIFLFKI